MELIRTSLLTGISTAIKLASAFAVNKVVAVVAGPSGMALIGQVQNMASILQGVSSGLFNTAAVKYSAEWKDQPERLHRFLSLSYTLAFWITLVVGTITGALSWWLAGALLNDPSYWWVFALLGLTVPLFVTNSLILSVINGLGDVKKLTLVNVGQSVFGLVLSVGLPVFFGLPGALAAVILSSTVVFVLLLPELRMHGWLKLRILETTRDKEDINRLKNFALMALVSAVCAPLSQLLVREWIVERCSMTEAGQWQGLMRLSGGYLVFFTTTLTVYFLPKFASLDAMGIRMELRRGYRVLLPTVAILFLAVWLGRAWLVPLLFSGEFTTMQSLLHYQLVGDFLKIGSWTMSFIMLARARTMLFVASEIGFSIFYCVLVVIFVGYHGEGGVRGALYAWIILYATYWGFLRLALSSIVGPSDSAQVSNR